MRTSQPQTIYLSDYKVPAYLVDTVDLRFELFEDGARVHSTLDVRRNPESDEVSAPLELDGDSLTLESVALDGADLAAGDYEDRGDQLVIRSVPEQFTLTVVTWIEPQNNTRLEGLYKSSGMFCTQCE
ncbi:MAG TPA: aminopeptidase N, partial [Marinobacter adhaerens]|nr:aminopeptidase N [Marinobacter adhaerens]